MVSSGTTCGFMTRGNMHYRAGLNMIPLIEWYRSNPDDFMLLEISIGAQSGQLVNIEHDTGAPSMMLHMLPHILDYDPHSGDFGLGFFGHTQETGAYYVDHPEYGPLCYQCDMINTTTFEVMDSYHIRVFIEPIAMYIQLDTGTIDTVSMDMKDKTITVSMDTDNAPTYTQRRMRIDKTSTDRPGTNFKVVSPSSAVMVRNAWQFKGVVAIISWQ